MATDQKASNISTPLSNKRASISSTNKATQDLPRENKLTDKEIDHLSSVMIRAKKFDEESLQGNLFEGQLSKYTNVVKGWQYRWFLINPARGTLEYYMPEERKKSHPRGCVYLAGCQIIPSEEDSQTFTVNSACGEVYKLKAVDAKSRQIWVNKLRFAAQMLENKAQADSMPVSNSANAKFSANSPLSSDLLQSLDSVRDQLRVAQKNQVTVANTIEDITNTDEDLLTFKATTNAAVLSLEQCFSILESIHR